MNDGIHNKHKYPIWLASDDYKRLKFQTNGAVLKILLEEKDPDKQIVLIMEIVEKTWKKIRGRDVPLVVTKIKREE